MQIKHDIRTIIGWGLGLTALLLAGCGGRGGPSVGANQQTINFGTAPAITLHGTGTVTASASSGLPISFSSINPAVCSVDSNSGVVLTLTVGTCIIAADQPGDSTYAPAPQVTQHITIIYDPNQTITFGPAPSLTLFGTATVSATASSGLAVSFGTTTPTICTVAANSGVVTDIAAGDCIVVADQAGDAFYNAAPQATQTLTVAAWGGPLTVPDAPSGVAATVGDTANTVLVSFNSPTSSGGSPITGYSVISAPAGISSSGTASPISVPCTTPCTNYAFSVIASNAIGDSTASAQADILTEYNVMATFFEPDTQPNDSIFIGTFTHNSTTNTVSNLRGRLSESMTGGLTGYPNDTMTWISLNFQLSATSDGFGGLLVSTFTLNTTNTFAEGGFAPDSEGLYYGYPAAPNPAAGGIGNAYTTIYVPLANPVTPLTTAQINKLAYGDCAAGGMMGDVCMTGYSGVGTMGGYPVSQTITKK